MTGRYAESSGGGRGEVGGSSMKMKSSTFLGPPIKCKTAIPHTNTHSPRKITTIICERQYIYITSCPESPGYAACICSSNTRGIAGSRPTVSISPMGIIGSLLVQWDYSNTKHSHSRYIARGRGGRRRHLRWWGGRGGRSSVCGRSHPASRHIHHYSGCRGGGHSTTTGRGLPDSGWVARKCINDHEQ